MEFVRNWYSKWDHIPWKHISSPKDQWKVLPTFLIGEYLFIFLAALALIHAIRQGRRHVFVWFASFLAGSSNDIFFMYLPLVDNFWQAQATIMLTPRLPLYICCVYCTFMYYATVTAWRLGLPTLAEACLSGLLGIMIYMPYDIIGIKFLWWTWHDTDPPISYRMLGVPVGSTLWVITFTGTFSFLVRTVYLNWRRSEAVAMIAVCLLSTPLMMVQMALLQLISWDRQGVPTLASLMVGVGLYVVAIGRQSPRASLLKHPCGAFIRAAPDFVVNLALCGYYATLFGIMFFGRPEDHVSDGIHQTYGPCGVEQKDFSGQLMSTSKVTHRDLQVVQQPDTWSLCRVPNHSHNDIDEDPDECDAEYAVDDSLPTNQLSCRAVLCQRWSTFCCYSVDRILRLPPETPARPQVTRYRRNWHRLALLLASLLTLTLGQTCSSGVTFGYCLQQLGACSAFLERDPCLKTMVPFFVVSLVWLSLLCSCCCQSPKALSVFLLVGLCGEMVLASYMVAFDRSVRIDDHLTEHLETSLEASSCHRVGAKSGGGHGGGEADVESRSDAANCFRPFRDEAVACRRFDLGNLARCNATRGRQVESAVEFRRHIHACVTEVLLGISHKKRLYQIITYSLLYMFASAHFVIALAVCVYDVRRKRAEKCLRSDRKDRLLLARSSADEATTTTNTRETIEKKSRVANNGQSGLSEVLVNRGVEEAGGSSSLTDRRVTFHLADKN